MPYVDGEKQVKICEIHSREESHLYAKERCSVSQSTTGYVRLALFLKDVSVLSVTSLV